MPFPSALDSTQKSYIRRSSYRAAQYIAFCPNTVVFTALVNGTPTGNSFAQVNFDNVTVGAYTDIVTYQTVYISPTTDTRDAVFVGRVRKAPTSSILYINETSAAILDNYYIIVIDDYRLAEKLARVVGTNYYKDWDLTFAQPSPIIYGVQSAYIGFVSGSPSGYTVAFSASASAVASGATISTYAWSIGDGTATSGSISNATVTVRFPVGFRWISLSVTDSGGRVTVLHIPVWAVPTDFSSVVYLSFDGADISADLDNGYTCSLSAFEGIDAVLDQTLCVVFDVELYGATETAIVTNVKFTGRLRKDTDDNQADDTASRVQSTRFELEGMGAQLASLAAPSIKIINDSTPTVWDEIKNLTFWRACCHLLQTHTTFFSINSLSFDDTSNTYSYPAFPTQGSSIWDALRDFLESINAAMQFASSGEAKIARDARYLTSAERDALVTVLDIEMQDVINLSLEHNEVELVGQIKAFGGTFSTTTNKETVLAAFWPGMAQGSGQGREVLNRQVLAANVAKATAQAELNNRIGYKGAISNTLDRLSIEFPDGYNWITPTVDQWYTFTIAADDNLRGFVFTDAQRWLCESISHTQDNVTGSKSFSATFIKETTATAGKTYNPPAPTAITPSLPSFPPFNTFPNFPDLPALLPDGGGELPYIGITDPVTFSPPTDGNTGLAVTANDLFVTTEFLRTSTPDAIQITPTLTAGETVRHACWSGFGKDVYCVVSDGDNSRVLYNANAFDNGNNWVSSGVMAGAFVVLRTTSTQGEVYAYQANTAGDPQTITDDLTTALGPQTVLVSATYPFSVYGPSITAAGTYSSSGGRTGGGSIFGENVGDHGTPLKAKSEATAAIDLGAEYTITAGSFWFKNGANGKPNTRSLVFWDASKTQVDRNLVELIDSSTSYRQFTWTGSIAGVQYVSFDAEQNEEDGYPSVDDLSVTYEDDAGNARTAFSTDFAATFTGQVVGDSPGDFGGIDTSKIGTVVLASSLGQTNKATSGGAYASYGGAKAQGAIVIPRYQFGSTTTGNTGATPQYLLASSALDAGESLWKVTASGATFTAITPNDGADDGLAVSANCLVMPWISGSIILELGLYDTDKKLAVSVNSGSSWVFSSALDVDALSVRIRKGDTTNRQAFIANGTSGVGYTANYRAGTISIVNKLFPTEDAIIYYEPFG